MKAPNQQAFNFNLEPPKVEPKYRAHSKTSKEAADKVKHVISATQIKMLEHLAKFPNKSADEIAEAIGMSFMVLRPRINELSVRGYIYLTGEGKSFFGNKQNAFSLTAKGQQFIESLLRG